MDFGGVLIMAIMAGVVGGFLGYAILNLLDYKDVINASYKTLGISIGIGFLAPFIIVFAIFSSLIGPTGTNTGNSHNGERQCGYCKVWYSDKENKHSIALTHLCKKCDFNREVMEKALND